MIIINNSNQTQKLLIHGTYHYEEIKPGQEYDLGDNLTDKEIEHYKALSFYGFQLIDKKSKVVNKNSEDNHTSDYTKESSNEADYNKDDSVIVDSIRNQMKVTEDNLWNYLNSLDADQLLNIVNEIGIKTKATSKYTLIEKLTAEKDKTIQYLNQLP